jgi:hypothetical protein
MIFEIVRNSTKESCQIKQRFKRRSVCEKYIYFNCAYYINYAAIECIFLIITKLPFSGKAENTWTL